MSNDNRSSEKQGVQAGGGGAPDRETAGAETGQLNADLAARSAPGDRKPGEDLEKRQEELLDEAVEETFPASDPIAPKRITK
jgi:hypothetical protein